VLHRAGVEHALDWRALGKDYLGGGFRAGVPGCFINGRVSVTVEGTRTRLIRAPGMALLACVRLRFFVVCSEHHPVWTTRSCLGRSRSKGNTAL
jgi:hypothetical protein